MEERIVIEIIKNHIKKAVVKIERCGIGQGNYVFIVSCDNDKYVLRCSEEVDAYKDTIYWLKRLKEINIPVSQVIASGKYESYEYMIAQYLNGKDMGLVYTSLSDNEKRMLARDVVEIQNKVATLKVDSLSTDWTWESVIDDTLKRANERIIKNGYFDTKKVTGLYELKGLLQSYFQEITPVAYLDDISTKNLLVDNGRLSGIIDVDWMGLGDRLTYVALTNVALRNMGYDTDYVSYILEEMNVGEIEKKAFIFYSLMFCVDFMGERGMCFMDKKIDVDDEIITRLNNLYAELMEEWRDLIVCRQILQKKKI